MPNFAINYEICGLAEPVLGLPTGRILFLALASELSGCIAMLVAPNRLWKALVAATVGAEFLLYHAGLVAIGSGQPCSCLGTVWDWTGIPHRELTAISWVLAGFIWVSGVIGMVSAFDQEARRPWRSW